MSRMCGLCETSLLLAIWRYASSTYIVVYVREVQLDFRSHLRLVLCQAPLYCCKPVYVEYSPKYPAQAAAEFILPAYLPACHSAIPDSIAYLPLNDSIAYLPLHDSIAYLPLTA